MSEPARKIQKVFGLLTGHGWRGLLPRLRWSLRERSARQKERRWLERHGSKLAANEIRDLRQRLENLSITPLISIVMPVYDVEERWLRAAIRSVIGQVYPNWELCIADDHSPSPHVRRVLEEFASQDTRIKVVFRETNGHISAASNSALELATGKFIGLLDHDDELTEDALCRVVEAIDKNPNVGMIYSDEDVINDRGERHSPKLKPAWSRDLFYSVNYLTHFAVYRASVLREIGGFRLGLEGSQDYDLALRAIEKIGDAGVVHVPNILYHWRAIPGSVALSGAEKPYAHERARMAIREHFKRTGVDGEVIESFHNLHRVSYPAPADTTLELIEVSGPTENRAERLNDAATRSKADVLVFIDTDLRFADAETLGDLIGFAMQDGIGAAGGRIIGRDMFVEDAGTVLGPDLTPNGAHRGFPCEAAGHIFRNRQIGNYSAISIRCMAIRRELFEAAGRFDARRFPGGLFDIDLCLRLWDQGKRIVMLPHVELLNQGIIPAPTYSSVELLELRNRWPSYEGRDPFCNPNLKRDGSFEIGL